MGWASELVHPTGDTDIRMSHATKLHEWLGAEDKTLRYLKGAPHYMEGHRPAAMAMVLEWLRDRFPSGL